MNVKNLPGIILLCIGLLCIFGTFSFENGFISFSDLFSLGTIVFFVGIMIYSRGNHKLVGIVLMCYGLLLFFDENYKLTNWLYMEYDLSIPKINEFFLPVLLIVLGLYSISVIRLRKKRNLLLSEIKNRNKEKNPTNPTNPATHNPNAEGEGTHDSNEFSTPPKDENTNTGNTQFKQKTPPQNYFFSERVIFGTTQRKLNIEDELLPGLSATVVFGTFRFDISRFITFEKEEFYFNYLCLFGEIIVKLPEEIKVKNDLQAYFASFRDERRQIATYTNNKTIILKGLLLFANIKIVAY